MDLLCFLCLVFAMPLCASVFMCLVVTCWERADLLALVCLTVSLLLCHWYPRSGVVLDCINSFAPLFTSIIQGREAESTIHNHRNINNSIPSHYYGQKLQLQGRGGESILHITEILTTVTPHLIMD